MPAKKAKPAVASGGNRTITVENWKSVDHNSLIGFLTLSLPSGLVIHNCQLLEAGERRWIGLPARRFLTVDGTVHYQPLVEFNTRRARRTFERAALEAVQRFLKGTGQW
jgi:hypothetical protein